MISKKFFVISILLLSTALPTFVQAEIVLTDSEAACLAIGGKVVGEEWRRAQDGGTQFKCEKDGEVTEEDQRTANEVEKAERNSNWFTEQMIAAFSGLLGQLLAPIGVTVSALMAILLSLSGVLFNFAIEQTVLNSTSYINSIQETIDVGWKLFRDLINMTLIFILLYSAIGTILGISGFKAKETIKNVIIVALLINFSLLLTKVVIDTSNVIAAGMYQNIMESVLPENQDPEVINSQSMEEQALISFATRNFGISGAIMNPLLLTATFNPKTDASSNSGLAAVLFGAGSAQAFEPFKIFTVGLFGGLMMLIVSFIFIAGSIMFLTRLVALVILMVVSPLALGSIVFPKNNYLSKWFSSLVHYSFFAPIFLFLIYFAIYFLNNALLNSQQDPISLILNFIISIVILLTTLVASQKFGIAGGEFARKWAGKASFGLAGYVGRRTVGSAAYRISRSDTLQDAASKKGIAGFASRRLLSGSVKVAGSSFDARKIAPLSSGMKKHGGLGEIDKVAAKGYAEEVKNRGKKEDDYVKNILQATGSDKQKAERAKNYSEVLASPGLIGTLATGFEFRKRRREQKRIETEGEIKKVESQKNALNKEISELNTSAPDYLEKKSRKEQELEKLSATLEELNKTLKATKEPIVYYTDLTGHASRADAAVKVGKDAKKLEDKVEKEDKKKKLNENKKQLDDLNKKLADAEERQKRMETINNGPLPTDSAVVKEVEGLKSQIKKISEDVEVGEEERRRESIREVVKEEQKASEKPAEKKEDGGDEKKS